MSERWSEKAWVLDLRKRLTTLVALSAVVGSSLVALAFVGVLGNQGGGEGIEDALILDTVALAGFEEFDVGPKAGKLAPDFEISDFDGTRHRLSDFRGKVVYVTFWASWCGPCKAELPDIEQLQADHPDDLVVVAVNRAEPLGRARSFLEDLTVDGPLEGHSAVAERTVCDRDRLAVHFIVDHLVPGENAQRIDARFAIELDQGHRLPALEPLRRLVDRLECRFVEWHDQIPRICLGTAFNQLGKVDRALRPVRVPTKDERNSIFDRRDILTPAVRVRARGRGAAAGGSDQGYADHQPPDPDAFP